MGDMTDKVATLKNGKVVAHWTNADFNACGWNFYKGRIYTVLMIDVAHSSFYVTGKQFQENVYHEYSKIVENSTLVSPGTHLREKGGRNVAFVGCSGNGECIYCRDSKGNINSYHAGYFDEITGIIG